MAASVGSPGSYKSRTFIQKITLKEASGNHKHLFLREMKIKSLERFKGRDF